MKHMKWWGWGEEGISFRYDDKPAFAAFLRSAIALDVTREPRVVSNFDTLRIPPSSVSDELRRSLLAIVGAGNLKDDPHDRVVHAYGKGLRDLVRIRCGDLGRLPDLVVYPQLEDEVAGIVAAALRADAVVIPFGGGSNISGSLEAPRNERRPVISVDMSRMNKVLEIDEISRLARIQSGALGPEIEEHLNAKGWTLGHFPDSFRHSTLGGWIATRSSGMQSDKYGDIADLTKAVRVVTPAGILRTRVVPSASTGPSVREMVLGSEGRLGIITEATVQVHRLPQKRRSSVICFPAGVRALMR
jgi:alkyldihydroxyacetonephosphate synthase